MQALNNRIKNKQQTKLRAKSCFFANIKIGKSIPRSDTTEVTQQQQHTQIEGSKGKEVVEERKLKKICIASFQDNIKARSRQSKTTDTQKNRTKYRAQKQNSTSMVN